MGDTGEGTVQADEADHVRKENSAPNKLNSIPVTAENIKHHPG